MKAEPETAARAAVLAYREAGPPDGDLLVLLHGFGGSAHTFDPLLDDLGDRRVILPDLPGHGRSFDVSGSRHPKAGAEAVLATLDAIGCREFHLGGFSMGGAVACLIALKAPERVKSLSLLAPGGFGSDIAAETLRAFGAAREETAISAALSRMVAPGTEPPADDVAALARERRNDGLVSELTAIAEMITRDGKQGEIPRAMLARIACPTHVLWGTADPVLPVSQSHRLPPHFTVRLVEGAGHMLVHEATGAVLETLAAAQSSARSR